MAVDVIFKVEVILVGRIECHRSLMDRSRSSKSGSEFMFKPSSSSDDGEIVNLLMMLSILD